MNRLRLGLIPLVLAAASGTIQADDSPFDARVYVAPMGSFTIVDKNRGTDDGFGGTLAIGKRLTRGLELELLGDFTSYDTKQGDFSTAQPKSARAYGLGGAANLYLLPSAPWYAHGLFVHVDVLRGQVNGQPGPVHNYGTTLFDAGLGWDFPLDSILGGLIGPGLTLRTEALYHLDLNNQNAVGTYVAGDNGQNKFTEIQFNIGLRIPIGGHAAAEAPPESPPAVVPVEEAPAPAPPPETPPAPPPAPPCQPPAAGQPISLEGCKTGDVIVLHGVNFDFNKATLTVNAKALLDQVGDALLARKDIKVEIDGHTDGKGAVVYNLKLSEHRAAAVRQYLIGRGIDAGRMSSKGFGKSMPVADNNTDEGREQNRRVELKVTDSATAADAAASPAPADSGTPAAPADSSTPPPAADNSPAPAADSSAPQPADAVPAQPQ